MTDLRTRIADTIRENDHHSCMYQEGIDADVLADAVLAVLPGITATTPLICSDERHQAKVAALKVQLDAVRDVVAAMDGVTGARFWAQQLHDALGTRPGGRGTPITWCGASMTGVVGADPLGPCVLRHGHDGPVHQGANGAKWWPTEAPEPDEQTVQCWHTEPGTPCDWDTCRQPERLAASDRGTDPGMEHV